MKDYLLLLDENEKLKRIVNAYEFYDDEIKSTTAGERVLTFKMNDSVVDIENGNKIGVFIEGKFDLFIVDQVEAETYYSTSIKVTCLHDFYSIQTQKAITQYYKESVSVHDAMTEMLKGTSYELGECVERSLIPIGPYLYKNPLWCIQDIISNFGVEIDYSIELNETRTGIAKKLVHVVNALGSDTGIRCSTDLNVSKIKRVQKDKFYTVMYGCGSEYQKDLVKYKYDFKDISWSTSNGNPTDKPAGQEFVEDKKAIAKYGRIIGIFEDGRIKDPELLLKKTWEALQKNNRPIVSYELDIEELKTEDGYEHLNFKLGDIIILQNTIDNSRAKFRIVEDCKSIRNKNKRKVVVGEQLKGIFSGGNSGNSEGTEGPGGSVIDPGGEEMQPPSLEEITPDTLPAVPVATAKGLWAKVMLSWTYESKMYYNYEVYASKIKDFEPTVFHMIYSGKASAFLHEVEAKETWYYRVRAVNTFGNATEFSEQVEATTTKVTDGTEYFETAAIKDALIEELRLDRGWIGTLRGHYIDARELSVTDGNNKKTLDIDSFGRITLMPSVFKMLVDGKEEDIITRSQFEANNDSIKMNFSETGGMNEILNSKCLNSTDYMYTGGHSGSPRVTLFTGKPNIQFTVHGYGSSGGFQTSNIPVISGEKHTLAFEYTFERSMEQYCEVHFYSQKYEGFGAWPDIRKDVIPLTSKGIVNRTIEVPSGANYMKFYIYATYDGTSSEQYPYTHVYIDNLRCFKSEFAGSWCPADSEMYVANIKFNGKGIEQTYNNEYVSRWGANALEFLTPAGVRKLAIDKSQLCTYNFDDGNFLSFIGATRNSDYSKIFGNAISTSKHCAFFDIGHQPDHVNDMEYIRNSTSYLRVNFYDHDDQLKGTHINKYPLYVHDNLTVDKNASITQDLQVWGDIACERNIRLQRLECRNGVDMKNTSLDNVFATHYGPGYACVVKGDGDMLQLGGQSKGDSGGTRIGIADSNGNVSDTIWISAPTFVWNKADWNWGGRNIYDVNIYQALKANYAFRDRLLATNFAVLDENDEIKVNTNEATINSFEENVKLKQINADLAKEIAIKDKELMETKKNLAMLALEVAKAGA